MLFLVSPVIAFPPDGFTLTVNETEVAIFECTATGIPPPTISWYRNATELGEGLDPRITLSNHSEPLLVSSDGGVLYSVSRSLQLENAADNDSGFYSCTASNIIENSEQDFELIVQGQYF